LEDACGTDRTRDGASGTGRTMNGTVHEVHKGRTVGRCVWYRQNNEWYHEVHTGTTVGLCIWNRQNIEIIHAVQVEQRMQVVQQTARVALLYSGIKRRRHYTSTYISIYIFWYNIKCPVA
jgi:hypothetical protein